MRENGGQLAEPGFQEVSDMVHAQHSWEVVQGGQGTSAQGKKVWTVMAMRGIDASKPTAYDRKIETPLLKKKKGVGPDLMRG